LRIANNPCERADARWRLPALDLSAGVVQMKELKRSRG
jgi:hypothetical protein